MRGLHSPATIPLMSHSTHKAFPLGPLLAVYAPDQAANITGRLKSTPPCMAAQAAAARSARHHPRGKTTQQLRSTGRHGAYSRRLQGRSHQRAALLHSRYRYRFAIPGNHSHHEQRANVAAATREHRSPSGAAVQSRPAHLRRSDSISALRRGLGRRIAGTVEIVDAAMATPDLPVGLQHGNGTLSLTGASTSPSSTSNISGRTLAAGWSGASSSNPVRCGRCCTCAYSIHKACAKPSCANLRCKLNHQCSPRWQHQPRRSLLHQRLRPQQLHQSIHGRGGSAAVAGIRPKRCAQSCPALIE